jgi:predicted Zn-dependent protease
MKSKIFVALGVAIISSQGIFAQTDNKLNTRELTSALPSEISSVTNTSERFTKNLNNPPQQTENSRERREQAYAKLLEGQRYLLKTKQERYLLSTKQTTSEVALTSVARLAKASLQKAVELDPTLAEAYTALAEITLSTPPNGLEEAIMLATIAVKINPDNYGGHRILARLYTLKSKLNSAAIDPAFVAKAISEWREIARLDTRNAEAYAFLSELYAKTNRNGERIEALKKWLAAAAPLDTGFYQTIMGGRDELSPENASLKLGSALLNSGQTREAIDILSRAVADNPENPLAIELLSEAVESADANLSVIAVQALTQAVYANPENSSLISLLAQIQARAGKIDEAAKVLRSSSDKFSEKDKVSAANLQIVLGDIYAGAERFNEAIAVYENALAVRGISNTAPVQYEERDFAIRVFEKMIQVFKKANRPNDVKSLIERARQLLGKNDLFPDRQL